MHGQPADRTRPRIRECRRGRPRRSSGAQLLNDSLELVEATTTVPADTGRHAYTHTTITTPDRTSVVESYLVHDMGHVWPGPAGRGLFTDRAGPDAGAIVWDFARRHPKGSTQ